MGQKQCANFALVYHVLGLVLVRFYLEYGQKRIGSLLANGQLSLRLKCFFMSVVLKLPP